MEDIILVLYVMLYFIRWQEKVGQEILIKKIRFYKGLLIEIIETLCTICLYLDCEGRRDHNLYFPFMKGHFDQLKRYSEELRKNSWLSNLLMI